MPPLGHLGFEEGHHLLHVRHLQQPRLAALQDAHHHLRPQFNGFLDPRTDLLWLVSRCAQQPCRSPTAACSGNQHW